MKKTSSKNREINLKKTFLKSKKLFKFKKPVHFLIILLSSLFFKSGEATVYIKKGTFYRTSMSENPSQNSTTYSTTCLISQNNCFIATINNGRNDTIFNVVASQINLFPNAPTVVMANGEIIASGFCTSINGQEITIPEQTEVDGMVNFVFQN